MEISRAKACVGCMVKDTGSSTVIAMAPDSYFQMMLLVNLTTDTGSKSITGDVYKCHDNGQVTERKLESDEELLRTLKDEFGICL